MYLEIFKITILHENQVAKKRMLPFPYQNKKLARRLSI
ncbi:hypothetical protein MPTP_0218 [Melissococcus plutonius ATCC 35311]|uniref:Uncharacterized protein n=2 Tax=Melissococcus plutonius TaxID=33970 RepID=F3Y888_MELPT|nr:hypothetical protein MPTP_0218 [Melissococcus plutonius ATCC 35311]BBC60363.1 hypothetical protein DAT561_0195 [Melissococcus plutonius]